MKGFALPQWVRSARFRIALLYSVAVFLVGAVLLGTLYLALSRSVQAEPLSRRFPNARIEVGDGTVIVSDLREFERQINTNTLHSLRDFSFAALGVLFVVGLGVGWIVSGRVLSPIDSITAVANQIQVSDLSRRIELAGPDDELKRLADTFDGMLNRLDESFARQRQFVADASHELRNPLAIIRTNAGLIASDSRAVQEDRRNAIVIERAAARMSRLVDDLLALARLDAPSSHTVPIELGQLAAEVAHDFGALAGEKGVEILVSTSDPPLLTGDREAVKRALANLMDNALRFSPGGARVRVGAGNVGGVAWIGVRDEGPGISAEDQGKVFDRFWRGDRSRSRDRGGAGLGLAIVKQVAETHSGAVRVFSRPGEGATFVMFFGGAGPETLPASSPMADL